MFRAVPPVRPLAHNSLGQSPNRGHSPFTKKVLPARHSLASHQAAKPQPSALKMTSCAKPAAGTRAESFSRRDERTHAGSNSVDPGPAVVRNYGFCNRGCFSCQHLPGHWLVSVYFRRSNNSRNEPLLSGNGNLCNYAFARSSLGMFVMPVRSSHPD